jgi:hypothetical protein
LHSHAWDNRSYILRGGYIETWRPLVWKTDGETTRRWQQGEHIARRADEGHSLALPDGVPYALTVFMTGPTIRSSIWTTETGVLRPMPGA